MLRFMVRTLFLLVRLLAGGDPAATIQAYHKETSFQYFCLSSWTTGFFWQHAPPKT
jgi:hypothetical protein